ncbi:malate dehydrogenase, mitochondrial-like [Cydia strobilella]|uniref:malate dehydrogenase, mitochondrial-like n=1 Tax=Cydia strobilella TaxID=1100964 RepID=UPI003006454F
MFAQKCIFRLLKQRQCRHVLRVRNVHISVIGAGNDVGLNLGLLLKTNQKVTRLRLYDDDDKIYGVGCELNNIPGGPAVESFAGDQQLALALRGADVVALVARTPQKIATTPHQMIIENAPAIQKVCYTIANHNPEALFAISTDPINCIVPFASALLSMYNCYNPFKVFGITHIDTARSRAFAGKMLDVDPKIIRVPVVGGHSDKTIVPLFSNLEPSCYSISSEQADMLTRFVRTADKDVILNKQGTESATLAMAWSIHEFIDSIVDAINGKEVIVNTYSPNLMFGTRYFSGPVKVGADGIVESLCDYHMNDFERELLREALPLIHEDVSKGEEYAGVVKTLGRYYT